MIFTNYQHYDFNERFIQAAFITSKPFSGSPELLKNNVYKSILNFCTGRWKVMKILSFFEKKQF